MTDQALPPDVVIEHTPEEIELAKQEIQRLTPEGYLDMVRYLKTLEENASLPEARAVTFTTLVGDHGGEINITTRGMTGRDALDELIDTVSYAMKRHSNMKWKPSSRHAVAQLPSVPGNGAGSPVTMTPPPQFSQPSVSVNPLMPPEPEAPPDEAQYVPVGATAPAPVTTGVAEEPNLAIVTVTALEHSISQNGKHYLKVYGEPGFHQYGVAAWPEVIPIQGYEQWPTSQKFQPPANMLKAQIKTDKPKKVTAFYPA